MTPLLPALALAPLLQAAPAPPQPGARPPLNDASSAAHSASEPLLPGARAQALPGSRPLHCEVTDVSSKQARHARGRFRATRVVDLQIEAQLAGRAKGERLLRLRVHAPGGFLYQVFELPLDPTRGRRRRFEVRLPVAGTSIMASGLYGRWQVVPHLDERTEPCGRARGFTIQP